MRKVFFVFFLLLTTICLNGLFFDATVAQASQQEDGAKQPYAIKIPREQTPSKTLFIYSFYEGDYFESSVQKINILQEVVSSHWHTQVTSIDAHSYKRGMLREYDSIFIFNETENSLPPALVLDSIHAPSKRIFLSGFNAEIIQSITAVSMPLAETSVSSIRYKDLDFVEEDVVLFMDTGRIDNQHRLFQVLSTALITADSSEGTKNSVQPFIFTFNNTSRVGENQASTYVVFPTTIPYYYGIKDYSIIFLDILHEVLGDHQDTTTKPALLRLEDVNVFTYQNPSSLGRVYAFLKKNNVPFHIALISRYVDPNRDIDLQVNQGRRFFNLLNKMVGEGLGTIVQHGYTHQVGDSISGVGYEFWDENENQPLSWETEEFVLERITAARTVMQKVGLPISDIWETPHYALSETTNRVLTQQYPLRYEHVQNVGTFPFPVEINNTIYIPENLGFISTGPNEFVFGQTVEDIEIQLQYLSVFRDPVPSFFWHPWRQTREIEQLVTLFQDKGYSFVSAYDLLEKKDATPVVEGSLASFRSHYKNPVLYQLENVVIALLYLFFFSGCLIYAHTILSLNKYIKIVNTFDIPLKKIKGILKKSHKKLPFFVILVPARNEGYVIENTIKNLVNLDYPKTTYKIVIIVDERELDDKTEILTKDVVMKLAKKLNAKYHRKVVEYIEVPKWYSGRYGSKKKTYAISTKGRALNFALQKLSKSEIWKQIDMVGVLDADGRMHPNVLKEAAFSRVYKNSKVLQGPVFQVSNFKDVSLTGIAAGIELAIHHLTELPAALLKQNKVQFLAGTNYFIDKWTISKVGGWNQKAMVEDAELALRIYIHQRVTADWIGSPEIEQTPANFSVYRRQRQRWVRGHLELIKSIYKADIPLIEKMRFFWKIFVSQFRFVLDVGFPVVAISFLISGMFRDLDRAIGYLSVILLIFAIGMWELYGYVFRKIFQYIDPEMKTSNKVMTSVKLFFFSPVFMFMQSVPRIQALANFVTAAPIIWYKTERTREKPYK